MQLPRRVPWASTAELDLVCSWIYADDADWDTKTRALHRLSAWNNITPLPHALEACLSILAVTIQDNEQSSKPSSSRQGAAVLGLRQNYSAAIIRMVNGLVDPLQQGAYARSIASIAAQIGVRQWLVELRHAATHEELPSLELLRDAAHEAMVWLLHNFFLPTLSPPAPNDTTTLTRQLSSVDPLLKEYKALSKTLVRDASLRNRHKPDVFKILRNIERWISEAKLAAPGAFFDDLGTIDREEVEVDPSEKWALDRICETLLQKGFLVPVSSKKRISNTPHRDETRLRLPHELVEIWSPLLSNIQSNHPYFAKALSDNILNRILSHSPTQNDPKTRKDQTFELCLAAWAAWLVERNESTSPNSDTREAYDGGSASGVLKREDVVIALANSLGAAALGVNLDHDEIRHSDDRRGARTLLDHLCQDDHYSAQIASSLLLIVKLPANRDSEQQSASTNNDQDAKVMEDRIALLESAITRPMSSLDREPNGRRSDTLKPNSSHPVPLPDDLPDGWSIIPESVWRPCPFGTCNILNLEFN